MLPTDQNATWHEEAPVFIMGVHRSGTTLLYQLLAETGRFNVVTAYHLICYDSFLRSYHAGQAEAEKIQLKERFLALGVDTRLIDNVQATPDLPEEYGFLFSRWGFAPHLSPRTLPLLTELCRKIRELSPPGRSLLLKNPADFSRFLFVEQAFPKARFVFIHRHPYEVISSQLRSVRLLYSHKSEYQALFDKRYRDTFASPLRRLATRLLFTSPLGLLIIVHFAREAFRKYLENIPSLDKTRYLAMRYEDLCDAPDEKLGSILELLGVPLRDYPSCGDPIRRRKAALLPEVERGKAWIAMGMKAYFTALDYAP